MAAAAAGLAVATDDGTIGKLKNNRYVKILKLVLKKFSGENYVFNRYHSKTFVFI